MLALTRRVGEEIVIGDPKHPLGTIRIVEIHGDKVRLSFDFAREVDINRRELADIKAKQPSGAAPRTGTPAPTTPSGPGSQGTPPSAGPDAPTPDKPRA